MEARGVEPLSENLFDRLSTGLAADTFVPSPAPSAAGWRRGRPKKPMLPSGPQAAQEPIWFDASEGAMGNPSGDTLHYAATNSRLLSFLAFIFNPTFLAQLWALRPAYLPTTDPRRNQVRPQMKNRLPPVSPAPYPAGLPSPLSPAACRRAFCPWPGRFPPSPCLP